MYVFITWILINVLHPIALILFFSNGNDSVINLKDLPELYFPVFLYSLACSIPSLFISYGTIYLIKKIKISPNSLFFVWLLAACVTLIINYVLVFWGFATTIRLDEFDIAIPGIITTSFVILIRYHWFIKSITPEILEET